MSTRSPSTDALRAGGASTVLLVLFGIIQTLTTMAVPALLGAAVNAAIHADGGSAVVLVIVLMVVSAVAESLGELASYSARVRAMRKLRADTLSHLFTFGFRGQRRFNQGDLVNRLTDSTDQTAQAAAVVTSIFVPALTSLGGLVALFVVDPFIGLTFLVSVPLVWLRLRAHFRKLIPMSITAAGKQADVATGLLDALRGMRTIRASGTVEREITRVLSPARSLRTLAMGIWRRQRTVAWETTLLLPVLEIAVLAVAGYCLTAGRISPGELLAVSSYLTYALGILQQANTVKDISEMRAAGERVRAVLDEPGIESGTRPVPGESAGITIGFHGVGSAVEDRWILRDITFEVPAGRTVALVGESGVGKTTLTALAGGLLSPDEGRITFDGVPVSELRSDELRKAVTYAYERPVLLGTTVADSLRYGDESISDARIADALRSSGAEEFVARLPKRADTEVAGLRLSGGEMQRLGLARAACRGARLVVLDDALSSVDTATEAAISAALQDTLRGATRLMIAHRASTASRADLVVWLHRGGVGGIGTHRSLLANPEYGRVFAVEESAATDLASEGSAS
ncbi:ABC transporter ATP-binding protein [Amycolatopsis minnesotensis]|uniref:ABC transporter ATP-binding protein n=1 Tax=Amycolatopsis minnesotensis TaxID=337894 RepID=A0ABN2QGU2_9PSEU